MQRLDKITLSKEMAFGRREDKIKIGLYLMIFLDLATYSAGGKASRNAQVPQRHQ